MLLSIAYLLLLALVLGHLCTMAKMPALVGMILAGIILGPHGLDLLSDNLLSISLELRQIALVIILIRAGLALDIDALRRVGRPAVMLCFVPACFEIAGMLLLAPRLLGVSLLDAAIMGAVVAAVSPAVVVPKMLNLVERGIGTAKGIPQMIMAGGSADDLFVIVLFSIFTTLGKGGEFHAGSLVQLPLAIIVGLVVGVVTGVALVWYLRKVHIRDTIKMLVIVSVAFLFLALEHLLEGVVPMSGLLSVMAMGATILSRNEILAKRLSPKFSKVWVLAEILLFVLVGASVNIDYALSLGFMSLVLLFGVLLFRMAGVYVSMVGTILTQRERLFCMIAYLPKATVQAAIGSVPLAMGLGCGEMVLSMAVVSILVTAPLGAFGIDMTVVPLLLKK